MHRSVLDGREVRSWARSRDVTSSFVGIENVHQKVLIGQGEIFGLDVRESEQRRCVELSIDEMVLTEGEVNDVSLM